MSKYKKHLTIQSAEADCNSNYKVYSFLCDTQEIANQHATSLGFGYNRLIKNNTAWVLSRIKAEFIRTPKWQEEVDLNTWHKGINGVFSLRDFEITDGTSAPMVLCTSSWLVIDLTTRKMLRTDHLFGEKELSMALHVDSIAEPCGKLLTPAGMNPAGEHKVLFSDIDFNRHSNNAKYMEWALDCIDPMILTNREIASFQLNINHETKLSDIISISISSPSSDEFFVEGATDGHNVFQTIIKLKP